MNALQDVDAEHDAVLDAMFDALDRKRRFDNKTKRTDMFDPAEEIDIEQGIRIAFARWRKYRRAQERK